MKLTDPVSILNGVGPALSKSLSLRGIEKIEDLLYYAPRRYEDYSKQISIRDMQPGLVSLKGRFSAVSSRRGRRGIFVTEAVFSDASGSVLVFWFNQPFRAQAIKKDEQYFLSGELKLSYGRMSIINPNIELVSDFPLNSARIVPVYRESKSLSSWQIRKAVFAARPLCASVKDYLPGEVIKTYKLMPLSEALSEVHFPSDKGSLDKAIERFNFNELFPLMLASEINRRELSKYRSLAVPFKAELARKFVSELPFKLTDDQRRIIWQIYLDMEKDKPMNRLVEGDVGSGKTVVATMAAVMALAEGHMVALLAPTELLARQHAETISTLLKPLGMSDRLILLTGSQAARQKKNALDAINSQKNFFLVGTHALLNLNIDLSNLALIIIDEQHRFGVEQRQTLHKKAGHLPHTLSITATPIPRSLFLTVFSDLDLSQLKSMPKERLKIKTEIMHKSDEPKLHSALHNELKAGRQIYVVCPRITERDKNDGIAAEAVFKSYKDKYKGYSVGLIHGKLESVEQERVMTQFLTGKIDILVATTIIEVGVDVKNASAIVIYGPEHYGLAQLHQLRGRVGRSSHQSYCFLKLSSNDPPLPRLREFARIDDGFKLSMLDLANRGPGAIYGTLQHGKSFSRFLTLDNRPLLFKCKEAATSFLEKGLSLLEYKELALRVKSAQKLTYLN